jgi:hypothetical protein
MTNSEHAALLACAERSETGGTYRANPKARTAHQPGHVSGHTSNSTPDASPDATHDVFPWEQGDETKPPFFLALQGGGAKGIVHIGAVNAIYDLDFAIQGVAGTSAGLIVAALVAAGYKPQEILNLDGEGNLFESFPPGTRHA